MRSYLHCYMKLVIENTDTSPGILILLQMILNMVQLATFVSKPVIVTLGGGYW